MRKEAIGSHRSEKVLVVKSHTYRDDDNPDTDDDERRPLAVFQINGISDGSGVVDLMGSISSRVRVGRIDVMSNRPCDSCFAPSIACNGCPSNEGEMD